MSRKSRGFTIVELMVVIAVIVILAAIAIVSYTNVQRQARNTSIGHNVQAWVRLLNVMYTRQGALSVTLAPGDHTICLGSKSQYPAVPGKFDEGQCYYNGHTSDALEAAVAKIGSAGMETFTTTGGGVVFRGLQYGFDAAETGTRTPIIWFELVGANENCGAIALGAKTSVYDTDNNNDTACYIDVREQLGGDPIVVS